MKRIDSIKKIMNDLNGDEIVVSSCGFISREVYYVMDRTKNFYVQGSMGISLSIGIGIALSKPHMKVIVIAGDGEILMSLGTLVLLKKLQILNLVPNLKLYILDNNCYHSTGGQPTVSNYIKFNNIAYCIIFNVDKKESNVPRINITHKEIKERFMNAIK